MVLNMIHMVMTLTYTSSAENLFLTPRSIIPFAQLTVLFRCPVCDSLEIKVHGSKDFCLFYSFKFPQDLEQCLAYERHSVNTE